MYTGLMAPRKHPTTAQLRELFEEHGLDEYPIPKGIRFGGQVFYREQDDGRCQMFYVYTWKSPKVANQYSLCLRISEDINNIIDEVWKQARDGQLVCLDYGADGWESVRADVGDLARSLRR